MCRPKKVRCFRCYKWFNKEKESIQQCRECGDFKCPGCQSCICNLTKNEKKIVMAMMHTYEKFIKEELKIKDNYNLNKHMEVEKSFL